MDQQMTLLTYSLQQARLRWSFSGGITMTQSQTSVIMILKCTGPSELIFIHSPHQTLAKDNPHVHIKLDIHVNKYLLPET